MPQESAIEFKGSSFTLPVIHLNSDNRQSIETELIAKINQAPNLFTQASVVVNVALLKDDFDLCAVSDAIVSAGINIVGFSGCNSAKKKLIHELGFSVINEGKAQVVSQPAYQSPLYLTTPLRSGQQVYAKNRDLVVCNLVSTGAEIIADGNIYMFNTLRGKAIAGANGNLEAKIFCTHLEAELISIAGNYWISEQIPAKFYKQAAMINLCENILQIEELTIT
ncbi:septum site-determining protein MinC [Utexia brackfieldae]|uniref:septum site-determining protein MinC n=1 Tax=Utexia brackfieldae TaxID=3074108 RepID=UPI00370D72C8